MNTPETHDGAQVVITTREFRMGQRAAWRDFEVDPDSTPNEELRERLGAEFWAGYVDEWENFCIPARVLKERRESRR